MAKTITISFEGTEYTLEFTRKSIEILEKRGFKITDIQDKPVTTLPMLFAGAFLAHHKFLKSNIIDEIFDKLKNKDELFNKLVEMYNEPILAMMEDSDTEENEGNSGWGASW